MPELGVVIASVREGRLGKPVSDWFIGAAQKHGGFHVTLLDLKEVGLPLLSEPKHPRLQQYEQETTKAWSALVAGMDAFVFVTPEYNYSPPPALVNALDHLYVEWNYKAVGFVSYGGVSAGTRSVQATKQQASAMKLVPIVEAVHLPFVAHLIENGTFKNSEAHDKATSLMLNELVRWTDALQTLRRK